MNKTRVVVIAWVSLTILMLAGAYVIVGKNRSAAPTDEPTVYSH